MNFNKDLKKRVNFLLSLQKKGFAAYRTILGKDYLEYPETTGYIISTLWKLYDYYKKEPKYKKSALIASDWLLSIQNKDGSFKDMQNQKEVFDTGMIILGLTDSYIYTKDKKYLNAAEKAGDWLVKIQNKKGFWDKFTYNGPRAYYSRVSWALLKLWNITKKEKYKLTAINQLNWVLSLQKQNGFILKSGFKEKKYLLHTIAYTIRGLLESYLILKDKKYLNAAKSFADVFVKKYNQDKLLFALYDNNYLPLNKSLCLTGLSQMSIIYFKLFEIFKKEDYLIIAMELNNLVKNKSFKFGINIKNGIAGSYPIYGYYFKFKYPNWAVKFYIDALLYQIKYSDLITKIIFDKLVSKFPKDINKDYFKLKSFEKYVKGTILDFGCGKGRFSKYFAEKGLKVIAYDPSDKMIYFAKKYNSHKNLNYTTIKPKKMFDTIIAIESLQHVENIKDELKYMYNILKKKGQLIIFDRNPYSIIGLFKPLLERFNKWMYSKNYPFKEKWYTKKQWINFFENTGFKIKQIKSIKRKWYSINKFYLFILEK